MPLIERPEFTTRRPIPATVKLILLIAVILGLIIRSCWYRTKESYLDFEDIIVTDVTLSSADVVFTVINNTGMRITESVLIRIYSNKDEEIASRITQIQVEPGSTVRFRKVLSKWQRGLFPEEYIQYATVEIYSPSIIN